MEFKGQQQQPDCAREPAGDMRQAITQALERDLLDTDGENRAVRTFLMLYGSANSTTIEKMRGHLNSSGFGGLWPEWVSYETGHLSKGGAQDWLRHLFALEHAPTATSAATQPVDAQAPQDFDAWAENPYTKVLQKSIKEDYVPRVDAQADTRDAARLDWLIQNEAQVWENDERYSVRAVTEHHAITEEYEAAREAIDAAMSKQQNREGGTQ